MLRNGASQRLLIYLEKFSDVKICRWSEKKFLLKIFYALRKRERWVQVLVFFFCSSNYGFIRVGRTTWEYIIMKRGEKKKFREKSGNVVVCKILMERTTTKTTALLKGNAAAGAAAEKAEKNFRSPCRCRVSREIFFSVAECGERGAGRRNSSPSTCIKILR